MTPGCVNGEILVDVRELAKQGTVSVNCNKVTPPRVSRI